MTLLRALILDRRHWALALLVIAFALKALVPAGFMISRSADHVLTVTVCSETTGTIKTMDIVVPGKSGHGVTQDEAAQKGGHCAFSGFSQAALGGADGVLLALAFAFILVLGLAPVRRLPFRCAPFLLPPLRGPPATI